MSFLEFEDYGIYGHGSTAEKSVPKQRTAADDWGRLSEQDREDVDFLRATLPDDASATLFASKAALTYVRRHG